MQNREKTGLAPGTVLYTGSFSPQTTILHSSKYDATTLDHRVISADHSAELKVSDDLIDWYDLLGMQDVDLVTDMGAKLSISHLALESAVDVHQRPKYSEYATGNFIVVKAHTFSRETAELSSEHVAIYFSDRLVVSFQETHSDLFEKVRDRLSDDSTRLRNKGADYLVFALLDFILDEYNDMLDTLSDEIVELEEDIMERPSADVKARIHNLKKVLIRLRKSSLQLRDGINKLSRSESPYLSELNAVYFRDLHDQSIHISDRVETGRESLHSLHDLYTSELGYRMNKVMQLLTLVSTIFIPITFLAGVYGMNFQHMPELTWKYSYPVFWLVLIIVGVSLFYLFKKKGWIEYD